MDHVRKTLKQALAAKGMDLKEASLAIGKNHAYLQQFLSRGIPVKLSEDVRVKLVDLLDVDETDLGAPKRVGAAPQRNSTQIALFDIRAGMGGGGLLGVETDDDGEPYPDHVNGYFSLPGAVAASIRNPDKVYALPVTGDSMEPTLSGGSFVFVDTAHNAPSPPDLYAVDYGDGLMVKRLELVPQSDQVRIISDNERYSDYTLERDSVTVYGRVIGWFQWR